MGILKSIMKSRSRSQWTPERKCILEGLNVDEIKALLGKPKKTSDGFIFWEGDMIDFDQGHYSDGMCFEISNMDFRLKFKPKPTVGNRETWFLRYCGGDVPRGLADEMGFSGYYDDQDI